MDFEVPTDLINRAQIGFREGAGLLSFDPKDTTLPSLPTVEAVISTLDSSPAYLRCKYCQGKLLRGLQSLICIYCGESQKKDLHPDPISFKSTNGYSWLLQSLNLTGSERIGSLTEGIGIHGGQSPAEDLVTISELLDLQVSWRDEPTKTDTTLNNKTSERLRSLNVGSADFDNFFPESKRDTVSDESQEQPILSKDDQNKTFENVLPLATPVTSSVDDSVDASSDWNAEFQFADNTKVDSENPKPVDSFVVNESDLSAHMDTVFGQIEGFDNIKSKNGSDPFPSSGQDWIQDDPFANMGSATFQQPESVQEKDGFSVHKDDLASKDVNSDWFSDATWQKTTNNNTVTHKDDNLFDIKPQVDAVSSPSLVNNDSMQKSDSKKQYSDTTDWFQDKQWPISASNSTTNMVASNNVVDDDNEFDEWNDFTGSTNNLSSFADSVKQNNNNNEKMAASGNNSELSLFESTTADPVEFDFGNFSQSDLFSGSFSDKNQNDSQQVYDMFSEMSTASRNFMGNGSEGPKNDEITPNATTHPKDDVQLLMSQMHDLSFMLKSELSIPSKSDDVGSSHS